TSLSEEMNQLASGRIEDGVGLDRHHAIEDAFDRFSFRSRTMSRSNRPFPRQVLLVEMNEITWRLLDPLLARGKMPTFSEFIRQGTKGSPRATEVPPHLDPWVSWTSVYTGRRQEEHGVRFLEQPPETVTGPRIWDIAADSGKSLGIFGS